MAVFGVTSVRPYAKASTFICKSICSVFSIKETITGAGEMVQHVFTLKKGPEFGSWHALGSSEPSAAPVPEDTMPSTDL